MDKKPRKQKGTVIAGVELKQPVFFPNRGIVEAESLEEAIELIKQEEVGDGN